MKYPLPNPIPPPVCLPSKVYTSKAHVAKILKKNNLVIVDFRPPQEGDLWLLNGEGRVSGPDDYKQIYSPNDPRGPARFIVKKIEGTSITLDEAWE